MDYSNPKSNLFHTLSGKIVSKSLKVYKVHFLFDNLPACIEVRLAAIFESYKLEFEAF